MTGDCPWHASEASGSVGEDTPRAGPHTNSAFIILDLIINTWEAGAEVLGATFARHTRLCR